MIHIAGSRVQVGAMLRQRCAWCGYLLIDYDLTRIAVAIDPDSDPRGDADPPATWPEGELVAVEEGWPKVSYVVEHKDGDQLPEGCCAS